MTGDWCILKFLQHSHVDGKHLMRFHSETSDGFQIPRGKCGRGLK